MSFLQRLFGAASAGSTAEMPEEMPAGSADFGSSTASSALGDAAQRVADELSQFRQEVVRRLEEASNLTGTEVIEIGKAVGDIVLEAQAHVSEITESLTALTDNSRTDSIGASVERQNRVMADYLDNMREWCANQGEMAQRAADQSQSIIAAGATIAKIASQSQILTLNAHIESSRLGRAGAGFTVIANEMQALSREIAKTNEQVGKLANSLAKALPEIAGMADKIQERSEGFRQDFVGLMEDVATSTQRVEATLTDSLRQGDYHLEQILKQSHSALSHLQYQDPMIQNLQRIDSLMGDLQGRVHGELGIDAPIAESTYQPNLSDLSGVASENDVGEEDDDDALQGGDIMLF